MRTNSTDNCRSNDYLQGLGAIAIAMAHDVAKLTMIQRPPRGRDEVPVKISRLLEAHQMLLQVRRAADRADKMATKGRMTCW